MHVRNSMTLFTVLSQINPVPAIQSCFCKVLFTLIIARVFHVFPLRTL